VALIARAENPLGNVTAAARLRARIPESPPLDGEMNDKRDDWQSPHRLTRQPAREIRQQSRDVAGVRSNQTPFRRQFLQQLRHSANRVHPIPRHGDHNRHLQHELKQVRPQHAPQPAERNIIPVNGIKKNTQIASAFASLIPSEVLMIFTIAFVTHPRIRQFISNPRYTARNPRRNAAGSRGSASPQTARR